MVTNYLGLVLLTFPLVLIQICEFLNMLVRNPTAMRHATCRRSF